MLETIKKDTGDNGVKKYVDCRGDEYYLGRFGSQQIAYVKISEMGSNGVFGSCISTVRAIEALGPSTVIMLGVAASMDDKLRIGDVVVAKEVVTYQDYKAKDGKVILRSKHYYPEKLYKRFDSITNEDFNESVDDSYKRKIYKSVVLSGGILLNDENQRKIIQEIHPDGSALEMEGHGMAAAAISEGIYNWILIKGICDFGHKKDRNKNKNQQYAMKQAIKLCRIVLMEPKNFPNSPQHNIFISGSHDEKAGPLRQIFIDKKLTDKYHECEYAKQFAYELAKELNLRGNRIVTGYGVEIGQAVVSGVMSNIKIKDDELNKNLACFPFPRMDKATYENYTFKNLKYDYRKKMISEAKTHICIFGAKLKKGEPVPADGIEEEFKVAKLNGSFIVPVGATGFESEKMWNEVKKDIKGFYQMQDATPKQIERIETEFENLNTPTNFSMEDQRKRLINHIISFLSQPWNTE